MAFTTQELSTGWQFKETTDSSQDAWLSVTKVPTVVHLDLLENGKIPDPFVNMEELAVRWVADKAWSYRTRFQSPTATKEGRTGTRTDLVFKGLDTFATVTLNGENILDADNMFIEYRVDVTDKLKSEGDNELEIVFASALLRGRELVKEHEHEHRFIAHQTEIGRVPVRKAGCHWGWDWGPILVTSGPWKPVFLETYTIRVEDVWFQAELSPDLKVVSGKLLARIDLGKGQAKATVRFSLSLDGLTAFEFEADVSSDGLSIADFKIDDPCLWYPFGYGTQPRYELKAILTMDGSEQTQQTKLVGFRKVELIQEKDEFGKSFYFRINNIDVFAGGSCWIPADSFIPRIGREGYRKWIELMLEGNQIMTRIWGGGIYEEEDFYDACDELGVLVWQDFAFACASYPTYPLFLKQVEEDARYNLRRLRTRPSLVIWAGNNEDYQIQEKYELDYDYDGDKDPQSWLKGSFPARYIYEYQLPKLVEEEDPGAVYHPSSPWGDGKKTFDPTVGDIHQWNVWHGAMRRYQELPTMGGRLVSEFGMEAYPHLATIKAAVTDPKHQSPGSMVMDFHNRAIDHERRLLTYVAENFKISYDLPTFAHLTQVLQSDVMDFAYRSWRHDWGTPGARKTGGILVWQFNDCWPTMSWAVADYYRVPKPSFYAIKRALEPMTVGVSRPFYDWTAGHVNPTIATRDRKYDVWVASSRLQPVQVEVRIRFISIKTGKDLAASIQKAVDAQPNSTTDVVQQGTVDVSADYDDTKVFDWEKYDPYVIYASLAIEGVTVGSGTAWPHPYKYLDFSDRGVQVQVSEAKDKVTVTADKPVHGFVFQEKKDWIKFSDNGFDVIPGEEKTVEISGPSWDEAELLWTFIGAESGVLGLKDS